jgi:hypothetical protein
MLMRGAHRNAFWGVLFCTNVTKTRMCFGSVWAVLAVLASMLHFSVQSCCKSAAMGRYFASSTEQEAKIHVNRGAHSKELLVLRAFWQVSMLCMR